METVVSITKAILRSEGELEADRTALTLLLTGEETV